MRHGYFMGYGYNGAFIFTVILIIVVVVILLLILNGRKEVNSQTQRLLEILKERYAKDEISADEYRERRMIIEDDEYFDSVMMVLKEQYVKGEIDSKVFCSRRNEIENGKTNKAPNILSERYAKGEISYEEYRNIRKDIE